MAPVAGRSGSVQRIPENRSITLLSGQRAALAQCTQRPRVLSSEAEPRQRALGDREAAAHDGSQGCCPAGWSQSVPLAADSSGAVRVSDGHLLPLARLWSGLQEYLYLACSLHRCFVCDSVLNSEHGSSPPPASLDTSAPAHTVDYAVHSTQYTGPHSLRGRCRLRWWCDRAICSEPGSARCLQLVDNAGPKRQMRDGPSASSVAKCAAYRSDAPRRPHSSLATRPSPADLCVPFKSPTLPSCSSLSPVSKRSHSRHILSLASHSS